MILTEIGLIRLRASSKAGTFLGLIEEEVSRFAEQLYVKSVPQNVRDFIDMEAKQQSEVKSKNVVAKSNRTA
mgnify:CR=1 FL=1